MDRPAWTLAILSFALLAFEISLMRVLSYVQWYHFAYMIISVALLGFGASGTLLFLFRRYLLRRFEIVIVVALVLCALFMVLSMTLLGIVKFDPYRIIWKLSEVWSLLYFYIVLFLPFLFGASVIGLTFVKKTEQIGRLYFANLLGSGLGALGAIGLTYIADPITLPAITASMCVIALVVFLLNRPGRALLVSAPAIAAILLLALWKPATPKMSEYKSLSKALLLPEAKIVKERQGPLGILTALESPALRYAPGLSLSYTSRIPSQLGVFADGEWVGTIVDVQDTAAAEFLNHATFALPYRLRVDAKVLVLGAGTGSHVSLSLNSGARSVTAVEMNSQLIELLEAVAPDRRDLLYRRADVRLRIEEARSFLAGSEDRYDLIVIPILEGYTASSAGTQALFENYLFTVESFRDMMGHLRDDGILSVTTWMNYPPRSSLKLLATITEAMREAGNDRLEEQVAVIRSWSTVTLLAKWSPFSETEVSLVRDFCRKNFFDLVYVPGIQQAEINRYHTLEEPILEQGAKILLSDGKAEEFLREYQFFVVAARDSRPYFSHFFKWESLPYLKEIYGTSGVPFFEWGYIVLVATLAQLVILSLVLIILPLFFLQREKETKPRIWPTLLYFGGIGVGYMFVEILMIQKFILFLGHPIFSVAVVVAGMLVFSGAGSFVSQRLGSLRVGLPVVLAVVTITVAGIAGLYLFGAEFILRIFARMPVEVRLASGVLLLAPVAFVMGFPFPLGLGRLSLSSPSLVPWAWGINGCASVVSATFATFVAINESFAAVWTFAIMAYILALASSGALRKSGGKSPGNSVN